MKFEFFEFGVIDNIKRLMGKNGKKKGKKKGGLDNGVNFNFLMKLSKLG